MPNFTTNINLEKPLGTEKYDIDVFNDNSDIIDLNIGNILDILVDGVGAKVYISDTQPLTANDGDIWFQTTAQKLWFYYAFTMTWVDALVGEKGDTGASIVSASFVGDDLVFVKDDATTVTISNAKLDLKGDTGEQGIQGIQGTQGEQGLTGETGASIVSADFVGNDLVFTKDDTNTVVLTDAKIDLKGDTGATGATGANFTILGTYATLGALQTAHPTGSAGDAWAVGTSDPYLIYIWDINTLSWSNIGSFTSSTSAIDVSFTPYGSIASVNVQNAIQELDDEKEPVFTKNTAFNKNYSTNASDIKMNGSQSLGTNDTLAKSDHVHPRDTSKQDTLISGTNIKTINGESVLGSGDIVIESVSTASDVSVDTTNFTKNLSSADDDVQKALETLDQMSGGQMLGNATIKAISYNAQTIAENITIPATYNASSVGPITIQDGYTVTLEDGAVWLIL